MHATKTLRSGWIGLTALSLLVTATPRAHAQQAPAALETVALFDPAALETPEGVSIDQHGNRFVSLALTGEIRRIAADGTQSTHARLPIGEPLTFCSGFYALVGPSTIDAQGRLYVSVGSCIPENRGIWRVDTDGSIHQLARLPFESFPNGIELHGGDLYVADSNLGRIWRLDADGGAASVWYEDERLLRVPGLPLPGANGIQFFRGEMYVSVTITGDIFAIGVRPDGSAGTARLHANTGGIGCDDFALDVRGNLYCATPLSTVLRVNASDRSVDTLFTAEDGLDGTTSVTFGRTGGLLQDLYITNAAFPGFSVHNRPSLLRYRVGIPGSRP